MYPSDKEKALINAAEDLMHQSMARYDPSHDKYHVQRVRRTALAIANALPVKPDLLVIELAALLHDVLDKKYVQNPDPDAFFRPFFAAHGLDDTRARLVARIVECVSWSTEKALRAAGSWDTWHQECVELHCVQDADRLDAIGAFGIMRCAAYSSSQNRALHTPPDDPAQESSAIQHFYEKLVQIRDRLKTAPGKAIGAKRHRFLLDFLASIEDEYAGAIPPAPPAGPMLVGVPA